jgi:hypothetical protein
MSLKSILVALALALGSSGMSFAQSQPNCGANAPAVGDTFGKIPSGTLSGQRGARRCEAYASAPSHHYHHHWRRHRYR